KIKEAKYGYVISHKNNSDTTTYSYLNELKASEYKDSKAIYSSLYDLSLTAVINDSETDYTTNMTKISKYKKIYCHLKVTGGTPNSSISLKYSMIWPDGSTNSGAFDYKWWYSGTSGNISGWYNTPAYGSTGLLKFRIYNSETNVLLGEYTVTLTN
ncbi:MAG: hypothetical protein J5933_07335, partial [Clostridia bacterium]|nr:hypothetical protein [Clostridia bacterium]